MFAHGITITVIRAGFVDDPFSGGGSSGSTLDWDNTTEHPIEDCAWAPGVAVETNNPSEQSSSVAGSIYAPYGADVTEKDRVRVDGFTFQVSGKPARYLNPFTGWEAGTALNVEEIN